MKRKNASIQPDLFEQDEPRVLPALSQKEQLATLVEALLFEIAAALASGARPARTGPAECLRSCASLVAFSIPESEWRKPRSASISARKDRRISSDSRGSARSW